MWHRWQIGRLEFSYGADDVRPFNPFPYPSWDGDWVRMGWAGLWISWRINAN